MMQTGLARYNYVTTGGWNLSAGAGERSFQTPDIPFDPPFPSPPKIALALSSIDSEHSTNLRVSVEPYDVERDEFNIIVKTWDDTLLYQVWITWIAYDG